MLAVMVCLFIAGSIGNNIFRANLYTEMVTNTVDITTAKGISVVNMHLKCEEALELQRDILVNGNFLNTSRAYAYGRVYNSIHSTSESEDLYRRYLLSIKFIDDVK
tara:strand:+ start:87717 stop:88034 length:318 start_codon:yes stop_codon:yes gene_type:complete